MKPSFRFTASRHPAKPPPLRRAATLKALVLGTVTCLLHAPGAVADTDAAPRPVDVAVRAKNQFDAARARFQADTNNVEAAWQFARACFDLGDLAASDKDREQLADTGIPIARRVTMREPNLVQGHYYLAMNLGELARTKTFGALRLVDQMEDQFKIARTLDEHFDYAGPDRNLGLLYFEAPALGSIGSRSKARQHLRRAVELAPNYPENRFNLAEALVKWGDRADAARELTALEALWPAAQKEFAGDDWAASWADWEKRLKVLKKKLEQPTRHIKSPRSQ